MRNRKSWSLKEWALVVSLFVSACTGMGFIAQFVTNGDAAARGWVVDVVRDSLDCCAERR